MGQILNLVGLAIQSGVMLIN